MWTLPLSVACVACRDALSRRETQAQLAALHEALAFLVCKRDDSVDLLEYVNENHLIH